MVWGRLLKVPGHLLEEEISSLRSVGVVLRRFLSKCGRVRFHMGPIG